MNGSTVSVRKSRARGLAFGYVFMSKMAFGIGVWGVGAKYRIMSRADGRLELLNRASR